MEDEPLMISMCRNGIFAWKRADIWKGRRVLNCIIWFHMNAAWERAVLLSGRGYGYLLPLYQCPDRCKSLTWDLKISAKFYSRTLWVINALSARFCSWMVEGCAVSVDPFFPLQYFCVISVAMYIAWWSSQTKKIFFCWKLSKLTHLIFICHDYNFSTWEQIETSKKPRIKDPAFLH